MPYDSNGNFTLNAGYLAVNGQVIQPSQHNPPLEDIALSGLSNALVRDGRAAMTGNLKMGSNKITGLANGTLSTDAVTKGQLDLTASRLSSKSGNYTALAADSATIFKFTAAATLSLAPAATLGENWFCSVKAENGDVIVDPYASELIDGVTSITIFDGQSVFIVCDGTAFTIIGHGIRQSSWDGGPVGGFRNKIINGDFEVAKRSASVVAGTGFKYVTDRWARVTTGSTLAYARQEFATGITMPPGNPRYYGRFTVASVASATNFAIAYHAMEDVRTLSGKTVTVTFYAKADASKNIGFELYQWFGLGGSPSSAVTGIGAQQCALTTSWQRFDILVNVPSISGKTRGTDNNDHLELVFWFDAGSTFASRASSIGQQSGTFDIAHVSIVEGDARQEIDPFCQRHISQEEDLCARYFQAFSGLQILGYNSAGGPIAATTTFSPQMRSGPSTPVFTATQTAAANATGVSVTGTYQRARTVATATSTGQAIMEYDLTADFEL